MTELRRITERYRLEKQVASSDAGSVFRGTAIQSGKVVAVKLINSDGAESEEQRERFLETSRVLQSLRHPGVPRVLDFGFTTAGSAFLVTEYLHGSSFEDLAGSAPARVLSLLLLLVDGLEAMAGEGVSTRNLRAENLLVVPGTEGDQVKILGLGSATLEPGALPVLDGYSEDLRAFGLLACQMLRVKVESKVGIPLETAVALEDIEALRALLDAALHGDPEGQYPSYTEVRKALRLALFGQTGRKPAARTETFATRPSPETAGSTQAGTVMIRRSDWESPAAPQEPPGAEGSLETVVPFVPAAGGTVILSSLRAPSQSSPEPRTNQEDLGRGVKLSEDRPRTTPEPLSESRSGGTARFKLPPEEGTRVVMPPAPAEPEVPARPPRRLPETVEIPAARVPLPPAPPSPAPPPILAPVLPLVVPDLPEPPRLPPPVEVEPEPRWTPPPQPPPAAKVAAPDARRRLLLKFGIPLAAILLVGIAVALVLLLRRNPPPPAPRPRAVAVKPVAPPPKEVPPPAPAPLPVHPQIVLAETCLGAGDLKGVKTAIDAITPAEQAAFRPDELDRYQRLVAQLTPLKREELASSLARALERGDLRSLRAAADSISLTEPAALTPEAQKNLARARKALEIDARLSRAQKSGNSLEIIRQADALLAELPRASRAGEQKQRAASNIETAADSELDAGRFDMASTYLEGLRRAWPDRAGLPARIERVASERKADQALEALLANVVQSEKAGKPFDGLKLLAGVKPNRRYADRFQEVRQRLDAQIAQLDREPPRLILRGSDPLYEKGKVVTIPLKATDDFGVKTVEGWARPEGGQYVKVNVRHLSGSDYAMDVPMDIHQNKMIEYYAIATDASGHTGPLASADHPNQVKRKSWLKNILRKGEKNGG